MARHGVVSTKPGANEPVPVRCACDHKGWIDAGCKQHGLKTLGELKGDEWGRDRTSWWRERAKPTLEQLDKRITWR